MSFLDDYQVPYKLLGVRLVSDMLTRVPSDLLLRTGVDALIFTVRGIFLMFSHMYLKHPHVSLKSIIVPHKLLVAPRRPVNARLHTFSCYGFPSAH